MQHQIVSRRRSCRPTQSTKARRRPDQYASRRSAGWGVAAVVLGTAFLLVLGYMLLSADPSPASVSTGHRR